MKIPRHLEVVHQTFQEAYKASREWNRIVFESVELYGERPQGGFVSGIYSEHFPEYIQEQLRKLAQDVSTLSERAENYRPKGVRKSTIQKIRNYVKKTEGAGYYG